MKVRRLGIARFEAAQVQSKQVLSGRKNPFVGGRAMRVSGNFAPAKMCVQQAADKQATVEAAAK